jgi:hypothetical protein
MQTMIVVMLKIPLLQKAKVDQKDKKPIGGVEATKKSCYCHVLGCGQTNHDTRNCPTKKKNNKVLLSQSPNKYCRFQLLYVVLFMSKFNFIECLYLFFLLFRALIGS